MPLCFLSRGFQKNKVDRFGLLPPSPNVDTFIPLTYLGGQFSEFSTPLHLFVSMWFMEGLYIYPKKSKIASLLSCHVV